MLDEELRSRALSEKIDAFTNALGNIEQRRGSVNAQEKPQLDEQFASIYNTWMDVSKEMLRSMQPENAALLYRDQGEELRILRKQVKESSYEPNRELADGLSFYPWLDGVSAEAEELFRFWDATGESPAALLDQVPGEDISAMYKRAANSVASIAQEAGAYAWGLVDKLIAFLDANWKELRRKLKAGGFGETVSSIRNMLAHVAKAVNANGGFTLELGTSGVSYQFHFEAELSSG
jgi:hypothetical protein